MLTRGRVSCMRHTHDCTEAAANRARRCVCVVTLQLPVIVVIIVNHNAFFRGANCTVAEQDNGNLTIQCVCVFECESPVNCIFSLCTTTNTCKSAPTRIMGSGWRTHLYVWVFYGRLFTTNTNSNKKLSLFIRSFSEEICFY